jgi:hypothetical protein
MTNWTPERIRSIADGMAARLGREVRVSPVTLPLIVTALRHYADDLAIASALGTAEYQVREWDARGSLIRELSVCRDATAAFGALEAAALANPGVYLTMGQSARILHSRGPEPIAPKAERKLLTPPRPEGPRRDG